MQGGKGIQYIHVNIVQCPSNILPHQTSRFFLISSSYIYIKLRRSVIYILCTHLKVELLRFFKTIVFMSSLKIIADFGLSRMVLERISRDKQRITVCINPIYSTKKRSRLAIEALNVIETTPETESIF